MGMAGRLQDNDWARKRPRTGWRLSGSEAEAGKEGSGPGPAGCSQGDAAAQATAPAEGGAGTEQGQGGGNGSAERCRGTDDNVDLVVGGGQGPRADLTSACKAEASESRPGVYRGAVNHVAIIVAGRNPGLRISSLYGCKYSGIGVCESNRIALDLSWARNGVSFV